MVNKNAWRRGLDPRDPDYMEPPTEDDPEYEPAPELEALDDDSRNAGPKHYIPMRDDV